MKNYVKTETGLNEADEEVCVDVFRGIVRSHHTLLRLAAEVAAEFGLHAAELNVVDMLGKLGPISMGRLSRETFISPSNTTSTVKKLEVQQIVARRRSSTSDREVTVSLTAKGRRIFKRAYPKILNSVFNHLNCELSRREITSLRVRVAKLSRDSGGEPRD